MTIYNRRQVLQSSLPLVAAGLAGCSPEASATAKAGVPRLGINLSGVVDWNSELPFVDVFPMSREWVSQRQGAGWGQGPALALDEAGWVRRLEPGCSAETPMCTIDDGRYPGGRYQVFYEGKGEIEFWGSGRVLDSSAGRLVVDVTPSKGPIWLRLRATEPDNPVRNIRVLQPGFDAKTPRYAFHPSFLERWRGLDCLRFMDWQRTNGSKQARWSDRPKPADARFDKGVPVEVMVDLANQLDAAPWFCMPHLGDDEYVTGFAKAVKQRLAPHLKVYVEYSNEVWNFQFQQTRDLDKEAKSAGISLPAATARRSVKMFKLWQDAFGGLERLVRVMPSQAANPDLSDQILRHQDAYRQADVLAIAPYFGDVIQPSGNGLTAGQVEAWSVDMLLDHLDQKAMVPVLQSLKGQKAVADKYGLKLVAYEGGQHLVGILGVENNDKVTRLLHAANAHPRMGKLYERYFDAWQQAGGDLHCHYNSMGTWSKWGSWGLMQNTLEDPKQSAKFMATMRWAQKMGQKVKLPA